ncbi:unnamed protein product [Diamesa hyperborea]
MSSNGTTSSKNEEDVLKILVATDIHLGYGEKDAKICDDSFITFEEILMQAVYNKVDMILLAGDLFHDASPTPNSLNKCIKLLRDYTLGDDDIEIEFLSEQKINFPAAMNQTVNYEDPNINVSIPVFSIHGNHDDISGFGRLSSMDLLSSTGLLNYFGKWTDLNKVEITPIVLKKNATTAALYGLSHIHDARLARMFRDSKVFLRKPETDDEKIFNIMVLHQNRADRGRLNFLPEEEIPKFIDLAIWGHEHDCRILPEQNGKTGVFISQPGSSVATSLSEGESIEKHCGILLIHKKEFDMIPIKLKTVRPFVFESVDLDDYVDDLKLNEGNTESKVLAFCNSKIEEMLKKAEAKRSKDPNQPKLPLIRLRVIYSNECYTLNTIRFGQQYADRVANSTDMLMMKRNIKRMKSLQQPLNPDAIKGAMQNQETEDRVEDVVERYFKEANTTDQLQLLSLEGLTEMCRRIVDHGDDDAGDRIIDLQNNEACKYLLDQMATDDNVDEVLDTFYAEKSKDIFKGILDNLCPSAPVQTNLSDVQSKSKKVEDDDNSGSANSDDDLIVQKKTKKVEPPKPKAATRGRGRGAATKALPAPRGRSKADDTSYAGMGLNITKNKSTTRQLSIQDSMIQSQSQRSTRLNTSKGVQYICSSDSD